MKMIDKILEEIKPITVLSINNANGINFLQFSPTASSLLIYIHSNFYGRFVHISTGNKERRKIVKMVDKILEEIKPTTILSINNANGINFLQFSPTTYSLLVYIHPNFYGRFVYLSTGNKERRKIVKMVDKILDEIKPTTVLRINNANGINFLLFSPTTCIY